ncbi:hypothetical protein GYH30_022612 [Glycine max]|uniref:ATP-dependent DNA helicase n=1 Tax=Glycine max TaxID=3847 RepID=A0A0R0ITM0_SOYBN|nr:hypothetical protein GYH30_022612 [Glycine max]
MMWYDERINKDKQIKNPKFALCCSDEKIQLPVLQDAPQSLRQLLFDTNDSQAKNFQQNIRSYNVMFAFTSPGLQLDTRYNTKRGSPTFHVHGQGHHLIGSLLPLANKSPKFAQLYIYDTDNKNMLDNNNHYAHKFRMARDKLQSSIVSSLKLKLIYDRQSDGRLYNLPNTVEVAALIVGDEHTGNHRGIIIEKKTGLLKRINELHPAYLPLQYPLLYPRGKDGYRPDIPHKDHPNIHVAKRKKVVDGYCMIESQNLNFVRQHQQQLRVDKYINLNACNNAPETLGNEKGKRVILPSSFVGSQRYMEQLYFDGMAICGHIGFLDLFLTLTCNPAWPEIQRKVRKSNLTPHDCPDVVSQIFKIKLNQLINDLKRGHYPNPEDIDKIISTEIPNNYTDPELYEIVSKHMIHGPCGLPNRTTIVDQDGFLVYRRTNDGRMVQKHGIELDNHFIDTLNVEWCNQSTSIKYLFKYINKGSHRVTKSIVNTDNQQIGTVLSKSTIKESMFTTWMHSNKIYHGGRDLTYPEYVSKFVYVAHKRCWQPRKQGNTIGRLIWVPPSTRELFYMRIMFSSAKGSQSYKDIRTVDNVANTWGTPHFLRKLFVNLLFMNTMERPEYVWEQTWRWMTNDIVFNHRSQDFPSMPYPIGYAANPHQNKFVYNEMTYDKEVLAAKFNRCYHSMIDEQASIFDNIIRVVASQLGGVYFLYGYGGTGKTFMWKTLSSAVRSNGGIVLTVASSGIASLLLPGGRTTHSKFDLAELLQRTKLIIWDEAPMCHKFSYEALDKSLKDIMYNDRPFGGKVIVFGGDFRQILPVVPRGNRSDIVHASLNASYIWDHYIGDGKLGQPNDGHCEIAIPNEFLIMDFEDPIQAIVDATYPDLLQNYNNADFLQKRSILASSKDVVDKINDYVLSLIPGDKKEYCSADNQIDGLCNETWLIVTKLGTNVVQAELITGPNVGHRTYIPRMNMSPSNSPWPFKLIRRQFPFIVSFAMTINKSQGQSLAHVGLYFPNPVFYHDQLYVALSRVQSKKGLRILIHDKQGIAKNTTINVVYKEVFANL